MTRAARLTYLLCALRPISPMSEDTHYARGTCCGNRCRHCPFEHANVTDYPTPVAPLTVRRAEPLDVPALALLARQTFASAYIGYQDDPAASLQPYLERAFTREVFAKALRDEGQAVWVAADAEGWLWGYAVLLLREGSAKWPGLKLRRLYVRKQAQGLGLGWQLLAAVEAFAKTHDAEAVWLETYVGAPALTEFYLPRGYARIGTDAFALGPQRFEVAVVGKGLLTEL